MRTPSATFLTALSLLTAIPVHSEEEGRAILGHWLTEEGESHVHVYQEESSGGPPKYAGKIAWLRDPLYEPEDPEAGRPRRDRNNPEPARQHDPIIGLRVFQGLTYDPGGREWSGGTVYDPKTGNTYACLVQLLDEAAAESGKKLEIRGYIGFPSLGQATLWTPAPESERQSLPPPERDRQSPPPPTTSPAN